jgi:TRAP-type uncharacterized transport system fused permease subunit
MGKDRHFLHSIQHFLIGSALTLKGFDKLSHHPFIGGIILSFGIIILIYFFYLLFKKHPSKKLSLLVHWFEAIAALFTAYIFFQDGAKYLPWMFLLASIGFFISIFVSMKKRRSETKVTPKL